MTGGSIWLCNSFPSARSARSALKPFVVLVVASARPSLLTFLIALLYVADGSSLTVTIAAPQRHRVVHSQAQRDCLLTERFLSERLMICDLDLLLICCVRAVCSILRLSEPLVLTAHSVQRMIIESPFDRERIIILCYISVHRA